MNRFRYLIAGLIMVLTAFLIRESRSWAADTESEALDAAIAAYVYAYESNWLPSSKENYRLSIRIYWPRSEVLEGVWRPPAVQKVE